MRKAYSLDGVARSERRAAGLRPLPYASMRKAFSLFGAAQQRRYICARVFSLEMRFGKKPNPFLCYLCSSVSLCETNIHKKNTPITNATGALKSNKHRILFHPDFTVGHGLSPYQCLAIRKAVAGFYRRSGVAVIGSPSPEDAL